MGSVMSTVFVLFLDFFIYFIVMFLVGFYAMQKVEGTRSFILGKRSIGSLTSGISAGSTDMSSWLILGLSGAVFGAGLVEGVWISLGLIIGAYLNWILVAKKLRRYTEGLGALTIPSYLQNRFDENGNALKIIVAVVILIFFTLYVASALKAGSVFFTFVFDLSTIGGNVINSETVTLMGLVTMTFVVTSYTFLGGYLATCWTDLFQGLLMLAALVFVVLFGYFAVTATPNGFDNLKSDAFSISTGWITGLSLMAWGLGYFGQPHILTRFMGIKSEDDVPKARRISILWMFLCLTLAICVGIIGMALHANSPLIGMQGDGVNKEHIFLSMSYAIFNPFFAGIMLCAVLAAIMSTVDAQLLVLSACLSEDLPFFKKLDERKQMLVSRMSIVLFAVIAFFIAYKDNGSILAMVAYAWGGFGASFGPLILLSVLWERITYWGAIAGVVSGSVSIFLFKNFVKIEGQYFYELLPSFFISMLMIVLVSLLTQKPNKQILNKLGV